MGRRKMLIEAVAALAADIDTQLEHLEKLGLHAGIDELALDYDAIAAARRDMLQHGEIDRQQFECIAQLDEFLSNMSGQEHSDLWTPEALRSAQEWKEVRRMAQNCLMLLRNG